jgi:hypothetical protein
MTSHRNYENELVMSTDTFKPVRGFWSETYRGTKIAACQHNRVWHVYLEDVMQANILFATLYEARAWLQRCVDLRWTVVDASGIKLLAATNPWHAR